MSEEEQLVDLPAYRGDNVIEIIMNLYKDLGWNPDTCRVDPSNAVLNEADWKEMFELARNKHPDDLASAGFAFIDKGPSADNKVPKGKILLKLGWTFIEVLKGKGNG